MDDTNFQVYFYKYIKYTINYNYVFNKRRDASVMSLELNSGTLELCNLDK